MRFPRSSGLLCHITSLPSKHGIGDLGGAAFAFVDFLESAGQSIWQMLPLNPPAEGNSPYSAYSAFAGHWLLISLDELVREGWLSPDDAAPPENWDPQATRVDFAAVAAWKQPRLRRAFEHVRRQRPAGLDEAQRLFETQQADWLEDFVRFEVLMHHFREPVWTKWPRDVAQRTPEAMAPWEAKLADEIAFSKFTQFVFDRQWTRLKQYANEKHIRLYGDMPIFVAHESADVWANRSLFALNSKGNPRLIAGVPPDYFSKTGQLWGNPQYDWATIETHDFAWWTQRFARALQQFDLLRVDHFRGFEAYWEVPATARTAVAGRWQPGPGVKPFRAAEKVLGELPLIAEDLGMITQQVHDLRDALGYPGMRVLQFGFDTPEDDFHRPSSYPEHCVAYTGTHDNDTVMGWLTARLAQTPDGQLPPTDLLCEVVREPADRHWQLLASVWESAADTVIAPIQDVLGLGNDARMNLPGQAKGNWAWRLAPNALTRELAERLRDLTTRCQR